MLDRWRALDGAPAVPPLPVNGSDLIALGYTPGPALGRMLNTLRDEFLEGRLPVQDALLAFAKEHLEAH